MGNGGGGLISMETVAWLRKRVNMAVQCWSDMLKAAKKTALISAGMYNSVYYYCCKILKYFWLYKCHHKIHNKYKANTWAQNNRIGDKIPNLL